MNPLVDRPGKDAALAVGTTWVAFMAALVIGNEIPDLAAFTISACVGAALVLVGFAATSRCRPTRPRPKAEHARLALLAVACGVGWGLVNFGANVAIARTDPALRDVMVERLTTIPPVTGLFPAPVVEEIVFRLFLMSGLAWVIARFTERPVLIFSLALGISSVVFAVLHLDRPFPADPTLAALYGVALVLKYIPAGLLLGFIFWRWGLPHGILCHALGNTTHQVLEPMITW